MKTSHIRFAQLHKLLGDLSFSGVRDQKGWRFEHASSNTIFLLRPYRPSDRVYEHDLFLVRFQLNGRGLVTEDVFHNSLTKTSA